MARFCRWMHPRTDWMGMLLAAWLTSLVPDGAALAQEGQVRDAASEQANSTSVIDSAAAAPDNGESLDAAPSVSDAPADAASSTPPTTSPASSPIEPDGPAETLTEKEAPLPTSTSVQNSDSAVSPESSVYRLEFRDSPWLEVLKWYAEKSSLNLDWQELPEGAVNLSLQDPYTLDQIRDVLNMQLLARGFTLLERGDILRIVKLENLDPTLIPRVSPESLAEQPAHQFVRVSFQLEWLVADQAAKELAPLLSPYGKLIPLAATNHLEAMDAVVNLRELQKLLEREQSDEGQQMLVAEFPIQHRRAGEIADKVRELLGMGGGRGRRNWDDRMRLDIERTRLQSQAVDKLGKDATQFLKNEPEVHIVVNEEKNSILVNAPPDKVALVRQAVEALDQPHDRTEQVLENIGRMKIYRLRGADPGALQDMVDELRELGNLEADTRIEVDQDSDRVMVYGAPTDQLVIAHLLQGLEQDQRKAEVIVLQVLDPRYAVQAVQTIFSDDSENSRWRRRYSQEDSFRVHADVANHRLLLWATAEEMERVYQFLAKLGEGDVGSAGGRRYQVVRSSAGDLQSIENRLRAIWETLSDAPLVVEKQVDSDALRTGNEESLPSTSPASSHQPDQEPREVPDLQTAAGRTTSFAIHRVSRQTPVDASADTSIAAPADPPSPDSSANAPVKVVEAEGGKLIIASEDPATVGLMQKVLRDLMPQEETVKVFPLEHASALSVQFQVEDLLIGPPGREEDDSLAIVPQQEVSVFADTRTNRLLVRDATPEQLEFIQRVIDTLDQPEEVDPELVRQQQIYSVKNKNAEELANTVKDVYQDLLSSSDKAFAGRGERDRRGSYGYWGFTDSRSKKPEYQGLLSIGVESSSNSLVVSAPGYLMKEVMDLIRKLDEERSATSTVVLPIDGRVMDTESVQEALDGILSGRSQPPRISGPERRRR